MFSKKQVQRIIDKKFLADFEFVLEVIAPELEQEDFVPNIDEICDMVSAEVVYRKNILY